jgi:hypothetical protein
MQILQKRKTIFLKRFTSYLCAISGTGASHNIAHNISKNWTQRIYRFWDIADLGFPYFYFPCKNCQELAQARITKVVGFFITNLTNMSLHFSVFSTIFYGFYKIQQKRLHYLESLLHRGPWEVSDSHNYAPGLWKSPRNEWAARNWVPGRPAVALPDSGEVAAGTGGERVGEALWLT